MLSFMYAAVFTIRRSSISHCAVWTVCLLVLSLASKKISPFFSRTENGEALYHLYWLLLR